ncbi:hypothetical protein GW17_00010152 [Ensete ventricosum]|nr:hypothetical protein GW17_00010152 [Ensete ventricosum]RZS03833.1 hypothetical protein BHM03_00034059 [Ensete ventricosum]
MPVRTDKSNLAGRYQTIPLKLAIDNRFRLSAVNFGHRQTIKGEIDRWRSIEEEKGKRKKKKKKKKKKRKRRKKKRRKRNTSPARPSCPWVTHEPSPPASPRRPQATFLPTQGERSRRRQ